MKYGTKNIELMLAAAAITVTVIVFMILAGGLFSNAPQTALTNISLFMIFGAMLLISIILLRIYDKLLEIIAIIEEK